MTLHLKDDVGSHVRTVYEAIPIPRLCVGFFPGSPGPGFPGGHRGEATPVPIPNTEVKGPIAEGTAGCACGRVGRRRVFWGPLTERSAAPFFFCGTRPAGVGRHSVHRSGARRAVTPHLIVRLVGYA